MISEHVYKAYLIAVPDVELSLIGGSIALDDAAAPHVQADIDIAWPGHWELIPDDLPTAYGGPVWVSDDDVLEDLDPRTSPRVRVTVDASYPTFSTSRYFDLGVRDWDPSQTSRVVSLSLASDEAVLTDHAPLADDWTPRTHSGSLRAVVNYVLSKALPGTTLEASPALDADVTPYWASSNLLPDASFEVGTVSWSAAAGAPTLAITAAQKWVGNNSMSMTATAAGTASVISPRMPVSPGQTYGGSTYIRSTVARSGFVAIRFYNAAGGSVDAIGVTTPTTTTGWTRLTVLGTAPVDAKEASIYVNTLGNAVGNVHYLDGAMLSQDSEIVPFFYGSTPPDAHYTYVVSGSGARRTPVIDRPRESLLWRAGVSALDFLRPLVQAAGYRLVCDEQRRWTLRDENYLADGSLNVRYGVNLIDGSARISRDSGLWYDARITRYVWTDRNGTRQERDDAFGLTATPTRVDLVVIDAAYPGPGRSAYAVRRAQTRGREVTVTAVADWRVHAEQASTFILDGAPTQFGSASRVEFDLGPGDSRDRMTITARTADLPEGSWLLGTPEQAWLEGPSPETWMEAG